MKKTSAILFLLLYFNTAFAIGIDCHYCEGRLANVTFKIFGKAECKFLPRQVHMGCCRNETIYCQTDDHQLQAQATTLPSFFSDYNNDGDQ